MDTTQAGQSAPNSALLQDNNPKYNVPPIYSPKNNVSYNFENQQSQEKDVTNKSTQNKPPFRKNCPHETVIHVKSIKPEVSPTADPIYLVRSSLILFITNLLYTMAIVSLGFVDTYNIDFLSHNKIFYFILFMGILSLTIIFVFQVSIRDCSTQTPFDWVFYGQVAISLGFLLSLIQAPLQCCMFLTNLLLLAVGLNAFLHYRQEFHKEHLFYILTGINILFFSIIMISTFKVLVYILMMVGTEFFVIYLTNNFFSLITNQNLIHKGNHVFLSIFIYSGFPLVILHWLGCYSYNNQSPYFFLACHDLCNRPRCCTCDLWCIASCELCARNDCISCSGCTNCCSGIDCGSCNSGIFDGECLKCCCCFCYCLGDILK